MRDQGMYDAPAPAEERKRLATFSYPNQVSRRVLDAMAFSSLIDAGAGPGVAMAEYVVLERKATYAAFDLRSEFVDQMAKGLKEKNISATVTQGDILNVPSLVGSADVVHSRFVFMHLNEEMRRIALANLLGVAKQRVVLLDYHWRSFSNPQHSLAVDRFIEASFEMMTLLRADPYAGQTVHELVASMMPATRVESLRDQRPEGPYSSELVELCAVQSGLARRLERTAIADEFAAIGEQLRRSPVNFIPPAVAIVIIKA